MNQKINEPICEANTKVYDKEASSYSKMAIFTWCIVGFVYAAVTWHVLWLPSLLIFIPGIFIASIIAAIFFIPLHLITKKIKGDWQNYRSKSWDY